MSEAEIRKLQKVLRKNADWRMLELEEFTKIHAERDALLPVLGAAEALQDALDAGHGRGSQEYDAAVCGVLDALNAYYGKRRQGPDSPSREKLGRLVREAWVRWAHQQSDPKPSWLDPWEQLDAGQKEVDMLIGEAVAQYVLGSWGKLLRVADAARILWKRRFEKPPVVFDFLNRMKKPITDLYPELKSKP